MHASSTFRSADLLLERQVSAVALTPLQCQRSSLDDRLAVDIEINIRSIRGVVPDADSVAASAPVNHWQPAELHRNQRTGRSRWQVGMPPVVRRPMVICIPWVDLINTDLKLALGVRRDLDACGPLAHGPIEPVVSTHVARLRSAECEVLEITREREEILAHRHAAELQIHVTVRLLIPELRQARRLSATPHLLHLL